LGLARSEHQPGLKELPGSVCNAHSKFKTMGKKWKENITLKQHRYYSQHRKNASFFSHTAL
jgi:hypothetical protein